MAHPVEMSPLAFSMTRRASRSSPAAVPAEGADSAAAWREGRKRLRDHSVKRDAVIRAAARAFKERGFHKTSLDGIAAALEVTKPTIYYYVTNKEQLLFECFVAGLEPIRTALQEAFKEKGSPARERLSAVLRQYARAVASEFGWCMVRSEVQDLNATMSAEVRALKAEIDQGIRRLLREGIRDGSVQPCDVKMTAFAMAGALNWIAYWFQDNQGLSPAQIGDRFVIIFEEGLRPRAAAQRKATARPATRKPSA